MKSNILICGAGGIGRAVALLLACNKAMTPTIFIGDVNQLALENTLQWLNEGKTRPISIHSFLMPKTGTNSEMDKLFSQADVILDCLPGSQAPRIAALAKKFNTNYTNLTEYTIETRQIIALAKGAGVGFLLQTGLAPGFINVLAAQLYSEFRESYKMDKLESIKMRVGALSKNAIAPHFYAYTWSPIGVATEYVEESIIVEDFQKLTVPSLSSPQEIIIGGETYEEDYTSGGAADLPEAFQGKVRNLDYKTLRYPGHYSWVHQCLANISPDVNKANALDNYMRSQIPAVAEDKVIIFAHIAGFDRQGVLRAIEKSYDIRPSKVGNKIIRAIQATTASALCESAYFLLKNQPKGVILQSQIDPLKFMNGPYVSQIFGAYKA